MAEETKTNQLGAFGRAWLGIAVTFLFAGIATLSYNDEGLGLSDFTGTQDINYFAALGAILIFRVFAFNWGQQSVRGHIDGVNG